MIPNKKPELGNRSGYRVLLEQIVNRFKDDLFKISKINGQLLLFGKEFSHKRTGLNLIHIVLHFLLDSFCWYLSRLHQTLQLFLKS